MGFDVTVEGSSRSAYYPKRVIACWWDLLADLHVMPEAEVHGDSSIFATYSEADIARLPLIMIDKVLDAIESESSQQLRNRISGSCCISEDSYADYVLLTIRQEFEAARAAGAGLEIV